MAAMHFDGTNLFTPFVIEGHQESIPVKYGYNWLSGIGIIVILSKMTNTTQINDARWTLSDHNIAHFEHVHM